MRGYNLFYMAGGLYGYLLFLLLYRSGNDGTCMYRAKCLLSVLMADKGHFLALGFSGIKKIDRKGLL